MKPQELEDLYIRSLDIPMTNVEKENFMNELHAHPEFAKQLAMHKKVRDLAEAKTPASFGPYFASKLMHKIENTGVVIDRQIFSFFKRFQLAALGMIVALIILNVALTDQVSLPSILGLDRTATPTTEEAVASFDFFESLNENL
ncbi:MAG TPA: hypothetical protein PLJ60_08410 [Chryseolinea sp.]|nr:hypothetical protein [Chryseolinea sp.]HPM30347.1 hypothetical protein [Chryseolinea sp.]